MLLFVLSAIFLSAFANHNVVGHIGSLCDIGTGICVRPIFGHIGELCNIGTGECTFSYGDYTFDSYQVAVFR